MQQTIHVTIHRNTCTVLYCTVLYCTVLYCTVLHCTVLYCNVLHCNVLYCTVQCCTVQWCTVLYCTVLYGTVLYCHNRLKYMLSVNNSRLLLSLELPGVWDKLMSKFKLNFYPGFWKHSYCGYSTTIKNRN